MLGSATGKAGRRGTAAAAAAASAKSRPLTSNVHSAPLPCQRHLFAVPSDEAEVCYLNAAYMSPSLATTELAWATGATRKSSPWEITKADFYDGPERLRAATASLIGAASPDCVALVPSSSYGIAVAARNLAARLSSAVNLVSLGGEHTSNRFVWQQLATEAGAAMRVVPPPSALAAAGGCGGSWGDAVLDRIDPDTAVVAITPTFWLDGTTMPLETVAARCREVGAALVIDATQWAGAAPFDVAALQPDFVIGAGYKWLLWPYGLGFLYASPEHHHGEGLEQHGWADSEQRSGRGLAMWGLPGGEGADGTLDLYEHPTARRLEMGGRPFLDSIPAALAATEQLVRWSPAQIAATLAPLIDGVASAAMARGYTVPAKDARSPHFIGMRVGEGCASLVSRLWDRHRVHVSARGEYLRVAPHLYNDMHSIDRLFAAIDCSRASATVEDR